MNIILFSDTDRYSSSFFSFHKNDERYAHIKNVLHLLEKDVFKCGLINGKIGEGKIEEIDNEKLLFSFIETAEPQALYPINLIIGIPRPIQLKRLLKDVATIGVSSIHLVGTMLGEKSYMSSTLIEKNKIEKYLLEGISQAGSTLLPTCTIYQSVYQFFEKIKLKEDFEKIIFDINYKNAPIANSKDIKNYKNIYLAFGSERGWVEKERSIFYREGFKFITLGNRILRTETACIAGLSYILTCMGEYK
ncbi:MAG: RsmE family RNA methyltransferase [Treponema sp.]